MKGVDNDRELGGRDGLGDPAQEQDIFRDEDIAYAQRLAPPASQ